MEPREEQRMGERGENSSEIKEHKITKKHILHILFRNVSFIRISIFRGRPLLTRLFYDCMIISKKF